MPNSNKLSFTLESTEHLLYVRIMIKVDIIRLEFSWSWRCNLPTRREIAEIRNSKPETQLSVKARGEVCFAGSPILGIFITNPPILDSGIFSQ